MLLRYHRGAVGHSGKLAVSAAPSGCYGGGVVREHVLDEAPAPRSPGRHWLGAQGGVTAFECVCRHGARSPAQCGQHRRAQLGLLLGGVFQARATLGEAVLAPGALLTSNPGDAYEFRHVDDGGDRTLIFELDDEVLDDASRSLGHAPRGDRFFATASAPASLGGLHAFAHARAALHARSPELLHEAALLALDHAVSAGASRSAAAPPPPLVSLRRVARAIRHVEAHYAGDCSLAALAALARVSPFHLVRVFRAATGQTPHQFVLATRLRAAEALLRTTSRPVTELAFEVGFGDLTNFAASFRRVYGLAPRAYRARAG